MPTIRRARSRLTARACTFCGVQLIVAEKPSVARDLARVLGVAARGQHYFESDSTVITWCLGHLVELEEPAAYDARWKAWKLETLPMLPEEFRLRPAKHAAAQLRAVLKLLRDRRFGIVINACDAGREGELIFRYVYRFAGGGPPVRRLWISSLTDEAIRRGLSSLRPGEQLDALGDAARCRSEADWLVGMNATRAVTARGRQAGHDALYSIGRVQTPTLAMLVHREEEIRAFVPRDYWEVRGDFATADGGKLQALWRDALRGGATSRLGSAALAEELVARDRRAKDARVEKLRSRVVKEPPPMLFDLTSLQRTANRRFGFSAARTLEIAQGLYERHKLLTYPRTDSRHLSSDMVSELPSLIEAVGELPEYARFAAQLGGPVRPSRRFVDDGRVSDHHAIIPTGKAGRGAEGLGRDEQRIFDLVVRRFLGAFFPDAEIAVTEVWICTAGSDGKVPAWPSHGSPGPGAAGPAAGAAPAERSDDDDDAPILPALPPPPDRYFARGRVRLIAGWQEVAGIGADSEGRGGDEAAASLPKLVEGQPLDGAYSARAKQTSPPRRFTEATLLSAMESAGKTIDDEALRAAMKDTGLGTPATRASIIETLLDRGYILRDKQALVPTATGMGLISALPVASLASPELTGAWEARLARVARGQESRAAFMADITRYVEELVEAIRAAAPPAPGDYADDGFAMATTEARRWSKGKPMRGRKGKSGKGGRSGKGAFGSRIRSSSGASSSSYGGAGSSSYGEAGSSSYGEAGSASHGGPSSSSYGGPGSSSYGGAARRARKPSRATAKAASPARSSIRISRPPAPSSPGADEPTILYDADEPSSSLSRGKPAGSAGKAKKGLTRRTPLRSRSAKKAGLRSSAAPARRSSRDEDLPFELSEAAKSSSPTAPRPASFARRSLDPSISSDLAAAISRLTASSPSTSSSTSSSSSPIPAPSRRAVPSAPPPPPSPSVAAAALPSSTGLGCPRCGQGLLITGSRGWGCSRWREGCTFVIWFETFGRTLTLAQLRDLIQRGKTRKARFVSAAGIELDGRLILQASTPAAPVRLEPA